MVVLEIRRATQKVLLRLPSDLTPMIREWIGGTRADWRTCKQREAHIIEEYNEGIRRFVQEVMARRRERQERTQVPLYTRLMYRSLMYLYELCLWVLGSHQRGH
jgi:hypothetical protein